MFDLGGPLARRWTWSFAASYNRWLDRRVPPANEVVLNLRNIFIFPTATGFGFCAFLLLLVLVAANYESSLIFGVAFLLGSIFFVTIFATFRNLAGINLELVSSSPGFVGETVEFLVRIQRPEGKNRDRVQLGWADSFGQWAEIFDRRTQIVRLFVSVSERGWFNPGRLRVETSYPLGMLRAWSWIDFDTRTLAYPRPLFGHPTMPQSIMINDRQIGRPQGDDDFFDTRAYQPGDPVRHVMWRAYARSDELNVSTYQSSVDDRVWLIFDAILGDVEQRLSVLTGQALEAFKKNREFGLRLPSMTVPMDSDAGHLNQVLRSLALYEKSL